MFFLTVSVLLAYFVYPTHPALVWTLLGLCWVCFRLGLRAQKMFREQSIRKESATTARMTLTSID